MCTLLRASIASSLTALCALAASATAAASPELPTGTVRVSVHDGASFLSIEGAVVRATRAGDSFFETTDADGGVSFPQLPLQPPPDVRPPFDSPDELQTYLDTRSQDRLLVQKDGYVPVTRLVDASLSYAHDVRLMPLRSGSITPVIDAEDGGTVSVPNVGLIDVEPGTLAVDAALLVMEVPGSSRSLDLFEELSVTQIYIQPVDAVGNPIEDVVLGGSGGMTLRRRSSFLERRVPDSPDVVNVSWESRLYDDEFQLVDQRPLQGGASQGEATFAVGEGSNFFTVAYEYEDDDCACGPWNLDAYEQRFWIVGNGTDINCGNITGTETASTSEGAEYTQAMSVDKSASAEVSASAEALVGAVEAKAGVGVSTNSSRTESTSTVHESEVSVEYGENIDGTPAGDPMDEPESCISGSVLLGRKVTEYELVAVRECWCPQLGGYLEMKSLGYIRISSGVDKVFSNDMHIDSTCGDECEGLELPEKYQPDTALAD